MAKTQPLEEKDELPLRYWKAVASKWDVDSIQADDALRRLDPWILASGMQKAVRRGLPEPAMRCALALWDVEKAYVGHRLSIFGPEDIGCANLEYVDALLASRIRKAFIEEAGGKKALIAMVAEAAASKKDRTACLMMSYSRKFPIETLQKLSLMSINDLEKLVLDPERIMTQRIAALWSIIGGGVRGKFSHPHPEGNVDLAVSIVNKINPKTSEIFRNAAHFQNEAHFVSLPFLVEHAQQSIPPQWARKGLEVTKDAPAYGYCSIPPGSEALLFMDAVPSTALDCHTREGRTQWLRWANRDQVFSKALSKVEPADKDAVLGKLQFMLSGHETLKSISYPVSRWAHAKSHWDTAIAMNVPWNEYVSLFDVLLKRKTMFEVRALQAMKEISLPVPGSEIGEGASPTSFTP